MCLLIVAGSGATPARKELENACINNNDGFGYAVHAGNRIITHRGMTASQVIDKFLEIRAAFPNGPALFHARIGTGGTLSKDNCHPFRVGGSVKTVLAHNGILPISRNDADRRSDTRIFAEDILPSIGVRSLDYKWGRQSLECWLGSDKVAVLNCDPSLKEQVYILNEEYGYWNKDESIWYSNRSYMYAYPKCYGVDYDDAFYLPGKGLQKWTKDETTGVYRLDDAKEDQAQEIKEWWSKQHECEWCGELDTGTDPTKCSFCDLCRQCGQLYCDCWYAQDMLSANVDPDIDELAEIEQMFELESGC